MPRSVANILPLSFIVETRACDTEIRCLRHMRKEGETLLSSFPPLPIPFARSINGQESPPLSRRSHSYSIATLGSYGEGGDLLLDLSLSAGLH